MSSTCCWCTVLSPNGRHHDNNGRVKKGEEILPMLEYHDNTNNCWVKKRDITLTVRKLFVLIILVFIYQCIHLQIHQGRERTTPVAMEPLWSHVYTFRNWFLLCCVHNYKPLTLHHSKNNNHRGDCSDTCRREGVKRKDMNRLYVVLYCRPTHISCST